MNGWKMKASIVVTATNVIRLDSTEVEKCYGELDTQPHLVTYEIPIHQRVPEKQAQGTNNQVFIMNICIVCI